MNTVTALSWRRRDVFKAGLGVWASALIGVDGRAWAQAPGAAADKLAGISAAEMERQAHQLPTPGSQLRLPTVALLGGGVFRPQQASGQVTVIYWWASTCPFCAQQSPEMQKLWLAHQGKGLQMLGLSIDRKPEEAQAYLQKKGYSWPSGWVNADIHRALPKPKGLPVTVVLGRDGRVLQAETGQMFPEDVAELARWL